MHTFITLLVLAVSMLATAPVSALSCLTPFGFDVLPSEGAQAPRNTRIWLPVFGSDGLADRFRWHDSEGASVAFSVTRIEIAGGMRLDVLTPEAPLRFPATYQVERCSQAQGTETCLTRTTFTTFDEIDEKPPALPEVEEWMRLADEGEYGKQRVVIFSVQGESVQGEQLVLADANGAGLDSPLGDDGAQLAALTTRPEVNIGEGACSPRNIVGDRADIRFGRFDLAGNFSGYTEPVRVDLPEQDGCALSSGRDGGWALLVLAALLRRRTRRQAAWGVDATGSCFSDAGART